MDRQDRDQRATVTAILPRIPPLSKVQKHVVTSTVAYKTLISVGKLKRSEILHVTKISV